MAFIYNILLAAFAVASPLSDTLSVTVEPKQTVNGTVEYTSQCKSCPYNLCTNVNVPWGGDNVTLTCWTNGDKIGDTSLWLKTTDNCYITEYDLIEYPGDFSADLTYCGRVPLDITRQRAKVRYLSECKWSSSTSAESIKYYGRDIDVIVTCWTDRGVAIVNDPLWYKTTDNCFVSGSGLWRKPDRDDLQNCGPDPGPRANETKRSIESDGAESAPASSETNYIKSLARRWLSPGKIGEEYAPCYSCPSAVGNTSTCPIVKTYEYNDTTYNQCYTDRFFTYPNGSITVAEWMLTTDWCYVDGNNFWEPPWDHYRYPRCEYWEGYEDVQQQRT